MYKLAIATTGLALGLAACMAREEPEAPSGRALYDQYCVICHGESGQGDGILAKDLPVPPSDLTVLSAGNGGAFPWSDVMAQIHGYNGRGEVMPEFGTILEGPTVMWRDETGARVETPVALLALAEYLATIQK